MKVLFLGSGEFGLPTLQALCSQHEVIGVVTSIDKLAGRNRSLMSTPVGKWSTDNGLDLFKPENVNTQEFIQLVHDLNIEAMVVIAFGQKLSEELVNICPTINLHASLLPRWRGAAPINAAVRHGDKKSGVSVITLSQEMDAGHLLGQRSTEIGIAETAGELHDRLALLGPELVLDVLQGDFIGTAQDEALVTYAPKMSRKDAILDLSGSSVDVANAICGYSPWPGCHLTIQGIDCKVSKAISKESIGEVGRILEDGTIAVGSGSIEILELKPAGGKAMSWKDFCNGRSIQPGSKCKATG